MENRFAIKDLFIIALLLLVVIIVLLAMKQFDRQYEVVRDLQQQNREQLRELVAIHASVDRGGIGSTGTPTSQPAQVDGFADLRKLKADGKYNQGDWLVQNLQAPVAKLTPLLSTDIYATEIQSRVIDSLIYRDPSTLDYLPQLATGWTIKDNSKDWSSYVDRRKAVALTQGEILAEPDCPPADKSDDRNAYIQKRLGEGRRDEDIGGEKDCPPATTITFKLRQGVTFSDGAPFTADDVIYSYEWAMNPHVDAPRDRQALEKIKSVRKNGDFEVVFDFRQPYFDSLDLAGTMDVLSKAFYSRYSPTQFNDSVGLLIGSGPYRLASPTDWKPSPGTIDLVRNDRYWGVPSSFDRLVYHQVQQESTSMVMFTNGDLDLFGALPEQYQLLLKNRSVTDRTNHYEYQSPVSGYHFIGWNQVRHGKPYLFADKHIRQAMTQLTDREGICKNILLGYAQPAAGPFSPVSKQSDKTLKDWTYDPTSAAALLAAAGFTRRGRDGVLMKDDGTRLSFKLSYPSKSTTFDRMIRFIADNYARAGVQMELDPVDWPIIEQRLKSRDYDAIFLGWSAGVEGDIYQMFDSSQIADQADNFLSYVNPELDKAIRTARTTVDEAVRMPLWQKCEHILHDDQPYTFLTISKSLVFVDKRIENVVASSTGLNLVQMWTDPLPWYVPPGKQKYTR